MENEVVEQTVEANPVDMIKEYLDDPKVMDNLNQVSAHFAEVAHNNWVTIDRLLKKSRVKNLKELTVYLDLLVLTKKAFVKKVGEEIKYKITLTKETRKKVLESQIAEIKNTLTILEEELITLV